MPGGLPTRSSRTSPGSSGPWSKSLEIEAEIEAGALENVVHTVTENSRTLKFTAHGFEQE